MHKTKAAGLYSVAFLFLIRAISIKIILKSYVILNRESNLVICQEENEKDFSGKG